MGPERHQQKGVKTMFKKTIFSLAIAVSALATSIASAEVINSLYNTGVDASHVSVPDGTVGDLHYTLTNVPTGASSQTLVRTSVGGWPIPPWTPDSTTSTWITPNDNFGFGTQAGNFTYQTSFDLTGYDPNSVSINGLWSFDDYGISILLNGLVVPFSAGLTNVTGFGGWDLFNISSGFQAGVNTLEFVVENAGGPGGLRTDFVAEGTRAGEQLPVPLPLGLFTLGLAGLGIVARKHNTLPSA
jgi:hypothetical protein